MTNLIRVLASLALVVVSLSPSRAQVKDANLLFETGINPQFKDGQFRPVPVFIHLKRAPFVPAAECKTSDAILADICTNCEELKAIPRSIRSMREITKQTELKDKLHSVLFTTRAVPLKKFKGAFHFTPGAMTTLQAVLDKYGPPAETEPYPGKTFRSWVGLDGAVQWWGYLGIAASPKGEITHILIREQEQR